MASWLYRNILRRGPPGAYDLSSKQVLVVGGTQGIGAATAVHFASLGASVHITGRNQVLGAGMLERLRAASPRPQAATFSFTPADMCDMEQVERLADAFARQPLSYLVLCAGGLNYGPRRETPDGIERTFAQNVLSRFLLIQRLLPALQEVAQTSAMGSESGKRVSGSGAVVNVLAAGNGIPLDMRDPQLKEGFSFIRAAGYHASMTDLYMAEFADRHPKPEEPRFYSFNPVVAATNSSANQGFPWIIATLARYVLPLVAYTPEQVADTIVSLCVEGEPKFARVRTGGHEIPAPASLQRMEVQGVGRQMWKYLQG